MTCKNFILTLSCVDKPGIVSAVTTELFTNGCNITESNQFWDPQTGHFFMRIAFQAPETMALEKVEYFLKPTSDRFHMKLNVLDAEKKPKIIIMVSKFDHAMLHLLYQIRVGWLNAEVAAIISNHADGRHIAKFEGVPFHHLPINKENKTEVEEQIHQLAKDSEADLVILARYMQILSDTLSNRLFGRVINIHHSFLPSFKGAKPYHQAHERGVKLIGATAHYVTPDLDEGPIIEQETQRVSHAMSADDFVAAGRDVESRVLARAVKMHLEARVMLNGQKTVVFR
jgi:formyltetrahydrofolate deformylase